jgi:hypothetical protein
MWYMGGYIEHLCLAESDDGIHWTKPELDVVPGTNIVIRNGATESNSLLMDLQEPDPQRRFKYFLTNIGKGWKTEYRTSPDGIHWSEPHWLSGPHGDRTTVFFNPFRRRWVFGCERPIARRHGWVARRSTGRRQTSTTPQPCSGRRRLRAGSTRRLRCG